MLPDLEAGHCRIAERSIAFSMAFGSEESPVKEEPIVAGASFAECLAAKGAALAILGPGDVEEGGRNPLTEAQHIKA